MFGPFLGDHEEKSLPQIHVDEEDDKRFQADLKRAVQQSLGMYVVSVTFALVAFKKANWTIAISLIDKSSWFMETFWHCRKF